MDERTKLILNTIIKEHIKTGAPVGSNILVDKYKLNISSATVRNEMARLEKEGYIIQPHISAGRIPTEKAYNVYLKNLEEKKLNSIEQNLIIDSLKIKNEKNFKKVAKILAKISNNAVFWAFHKHNLYYTGISNLFSQPEFANSNLIYNISEIIDRIDEIVDDIFDNINEDIQVLIGGKNPFGDFCSTIITKYKKNGNIGMFGILAPMRMDYKKNIAAVKFIKEKLN